MSTCPDYHPLTSDEELYVLIIHEVVDYPAWKEIFYAAGCIRKTAGERAYQVLCYLGGSTGNGLFFAAAFSLK